MVGQSLKQAIQMGLSQGRMAAARSIRTNSPTSMSRLATKIRPCRWIQGQARDYWAVFKWYVNIPLASVDSTQELWSLISTSLCFLVLTFAGSVLTTKGRHWPIEKGRWTASNSERLQAHTSLQWTHLTLSSWAPAFPHRSQQCDSMFFSVPLLLCQFSYLRGHS